MRMERFRGVPDLHGMLKVHVERGTSAPPELVLGTLRDPSPERRGEIWSNITPKQFTLHDSGPDFLDVTEGTFLVGVFWERSRYEWTEPGRVVSTVSESNVQARQQVRAPRHGARGWRHSGRVRPSARVPARDEGTDRRDGQPPRRPAPVWLVVGAGAGTDRCDVDAARRAARAARSAVSVGDEAARAGRLKRLGRRPLPRLSE